MKRRTVISAAGALAATGIFAQQPQAQETTEPSRAAIAGQVTELRFRATRGDADENADVELFVRMRDPAGRERKIPAFWAGGNHWAVRYAPESPGTHRWVSEAPNRQDPGLHGQSGSLEVLPAATDDNPLLRRGPLRVASSKRYLEHADGTPFFWLGDTWWMALSSRLGWPGDFRMLVADRVAKGFNAVQLVAGLYPDMDSFDPRGANEAGFPWEPGYRQLNPKWWDLADLRIQTLVDAGIVPCILGCWGYYLPILGEEKMRRHWREVIARWGAYPVVWCLAGEGSMPWYLSTTKEADRKALEQGWTAMARYVRETDPYGRLITIHPSRAGRDVITDPTVLDFDMLQTGHGDYRSLGNTLKLASAGYAREPKMPVLQAEVCYEGILGRCNDTIVRQMFWASVLNGCCGFTYGANGIWQVNLPGKPFGASPHGNNWGSTPWRDAAQLPGSGQLGRFAELLRTLPWHRMEPHPEWVSPQWQEREPDRPYAAGIPGELRVVYIPSMWGRATLRGLESGIRYRMRTMHPITGEISDFGEAAGNAEGDFEVPLFPELRDWVLILQRT